MVGVRWAEVRPSTLTTTSTSCCCILAAVWIEDMGYRYTALLLSVSCAVCLKSVETIEARHSLESVSISVTTLLS